MELIRGTQTNRLDRWSLLIVLILGLMLGTLGFSLWDKMPATVERVTWDPEAQWIAPREQSYRFYVRRTFEVADTVKVAWLRLSADDDFILYVNGIAIARELSVLRSSQGLANKLSESYQNFNDSLTYRAPGVPEFFINPARHWKLTTYIDLTAYLHPGKNTIALEIQKSRKNPRVVVEGAVYPVQNAPPINLTTGATPWQVSTLAETHQQLRWFDPDFPDESWPEAVAIGPVQEATYSRLSQHLFDRLLEGNWIVGTESQKGEMWLRGDWQVPKTRQRAFIRLAGDGEYGLLINGLLVISIPNRDLVKDSNQLHMYEVTNFLKTGRNTLAVRLARPLASIPMRDLYRLNENPHNSSTQDSSLGFFLDGWVETKQNNITAPIATDSTWITLNQPTSDWVKGVGVGQPATILRPPDPQEFQRRFEGNAYLLNYPDYLWHSSLWQLGGMACALVCSWGLGHFWLGRRHGWWDSFSAGAGLLLLGTLFLIGIGLLKHRYAEAEGGFLFVQPVSTPLIFLGFLGIVVLTLLWSQMKRGQRGWGLWFLLGLITFVSLDFATEGMAFSWSPSLLLAFVGIGEIVVLTLWNRVWNLSLWFKVVLQAWSSWGQWFLLVLIVGIGFGLRAYDLGFIDLMADENTSFDTIRGILHKGVPEPASHIWYTRGPAYHYMVALWLRLVGDSAVNARFLSVLWGTATLVLVFVFTRQITGIGVALAVVAILAINPWCLMMSRIVRFYQVLQFMSLLSFWLFLKGFVDRRGRSYQYGFFIALTFALLNQEVTLTLLPCFLIGFLFFYRPFYWSVDWPIAVSSLMSMVIFVYDLIFFSIKCLTPWVALSDSTDSYLKLHLSDVTGFISSLLVGANRMHTIYSFFFLFGFLYFVKKQDAKIVFLFSSVFINLIVMTLLLYQTAPRYTYPIYPLFILLSVYSAVCLISSLGRRFELKLEGLLPLRSIALGFLALLLISNIEPGRVLAGYQDAINKRNTEVFEYIRAHRQPGDIVVSATPFPAAIVMGGLDYFLLPAFRTPGAAFDTVYWREGRVIDRYAGGLVINNLDQMNHVLEKANRVWLNIDDSKLESQAIEPATANYFQTLGQPVMETFGTRLRLWQRKDGLLPGVPNQGRDLGAY